MDVRFDSEGFTKELMASASLPDGILNDYELVDQMKAPSEQAVYLLKGKADGEEYILKCRSAVYHADLKNEYELLRSLEYAGLDIAPAPVSCFECEGRSFLIEKRLAGETVAERVERTGAMTVSESLPVWIGMCDVLERLHRQSPPIIHRDVKPEHIIIAPDGKVRIIDLGIARRVRRGKSRDTCFYGTEQTAAPEQYGFKQTDAKTDIYAMGVTMRYMLTGSYDADASIADSPKRVRGIINVCVNFDPSGRYKSASELRRVLLSLKRPAFLRGPVGVKSRKIARLIAVCAALAAVLALAVFGSGWIERVSAAQVYVFKEPRIERAVRTELQIAEDEPVRASDLKNVKKLALLDSREADSDKVYEYAKGYDIYTHESDVFEDIVVSVEDVGYMTNLERLALANQDIRDISPLAGLSKLQVLAISGNDISDFTPLASLKELTVLNIGANPATDLTPIGELSKLTLLETHCLDPDDLKFLISLQNLSELRLMWCKPKDNDYSPIAELKSLNSITLYNLGAEVIPFIGNGILPDLNYVALVGDKVVYTKKDIASLSAITEFNMNQVLVRDTDCLRALVNLQKLTICYAPNPLDFSFIDDMPQLYFLDIWGTKPLDCGPFARHPTLFRINCEADVKKEILALGASERFIFDQ